MQAIGKEESVELRDKAVFKAIGYINGILSNELIGTWNF